MVVLEAKIVKKVLFGVMAGLFVATIPASVSAGDKGSQNQTEGRIYNTTKQPDSNDSEHIRINYDNASDHNHSILPQKGKVFEAREPKRHRNRRTSDSSR